MKAAIQTDLLPLVQVFLNKERSTTAIVRMFNAAVLVGECRKLTSSLFL